MPKLLYNILYLAVITALKMYKYDWTYATAYT